MQTTCFSVTLIPLLEQDVLDHLLAVRPAAMSATDIRERFGHDASPGGELHKALSSNQKVEVTPQGEYFYKVSSINCSTLSFIGCCSVHA